MSCGRLSKRWYTSLIKTRLRLILAGKLSCRYVIGYAYGTLAMALANDTTYSLRIKRTGEPFAPTQTLIEIGIGEGDFVIVEKA